MSISSPVRPVIMIQSLLTQQTDNWNVQRWYWLRIAWLPNDLHTSPLFWVCIILMSWRVPGCSLRCLAKLRSQIAPRVSSGVGSSQSIANILWTFCNNPSWLLSWRQLLFTLKCAKVEMEDWQLLNGVSVAVIRLLVLIVVVIFEKLSCGIWGKNRLTCDPGQRLMAK